MMLFEPFRIKSMEIPNRFVRSATYDGSAEKDGSTSERQIALYEGLARESFLYRRQSFAVVLVVEVFVI